MGETPTELKADIDHTLKHMDDVVEALGDRLRGRWHTMRQRLTPRALATQHPLAAFGSLMAVALGIAGLVRVNLWLSKRQLQRRPIQIYLRPPR